VALRAVNANECDKQKLKCAPLRRDESSPRARIEHARKLIEDGQRREEVNDLFKVSRSTLYRALVA